MAEMILKATGSKLQIISAIHVTSTQAQYDTCLFEFDEAWDGYAMRTAVFYSNPNNIKPMLLDSNNRCHIPWDAFSNSRYLYIGVYGNNGSSYLPTQFVEVMYQPGANQDDHLYPPTPGIYEQIASHIAAFSASPNGVYANLAALIAADPDHSKIYITLDDGKWCYWNGTTFVAGGVYQNVSYHELISETALKADAMASGSPKGQYATLVALQSAFPTGDTGAYLVEADSHLYFWDSVTSAWIDGGEYNVAHASKVSITDTDGHYDALNVEDALSEVGHTINRTAGVLHVKEYGAIGDGVTDDTAAINAAIAAAVASGTSVFTRKRVSFANGNFLTTGITIANDDVSLCGPGNITLDTSGTVALTITSVTNCKFDDLRIMLTAANQKGILLNSSVERQSQLHTFRNIYINGDNKPETTAIEIETAYVNSFYDCRFFWTTYGVVLTGPSANANFFHGCEIRANPSVAPELKKRAITQTWGQCNVFQSCVIENQVSAVLMTGGSLCLDGCYTEAFSGGRPFVINGGIFEIKSSLLKGLFSIGDAKAVSITNCEISSVATNASYPFISFTGDYDCAVTMRDNIIPADFFHALYGKYYNGSAYIDRSITKIHEAYLDRNQVYTGTIPSAANISGDGTRFYVPLTSTLNPYGEMTDATGYFLAIDDGLFEFTVSVVLDGLTTDHTVANLQLFRAGTYYAIRTIDSKLVGDAVVMRLSASIVEKGISDASWRISVKVDGTSKVAGISSGYYSVKRLA